MKNILAAFTVGTISFYSMAGYAGESKETQLKDKKDKVSYSIGVDVGKSIEKQKLDLNPDAFIAGFKDGQKNQSTLMTENEIRQTLLTLQTEMIEKQKAEIKALAVKNLAEGEKFLTENKKKEGVVTLPDGLQYRIVKEGKGDKPTATDTVITHYRGRFIDGTEFDSSYARGEPVKFMVNGVIPGWTEALQLMRPGSKWELFIPSKLAYGEQGVGQLIGPNATLIFDVELIEVQNSVDQDKTDKTDKVEKEEKGKKKK